MRPTLYKRADALFLRLVAALLFLGVSAYAGAFLLDGLRPAAAAGADTADEPLVLRGIAVRRERVLYAAPDAQSGRRLPASATAGAGSAVWLSGTDGFEDLCPEGLDALDAAGLRALLERDGSPDPDAAGRLVLGGDWYFCALTREETADCAPGPCRLLFDGFSRSVPARLVRARAEDGETLLLFRLTEGGELLTIRKTQALLLAGA